MARFLRIVPLLFLSCLTAYSQTGISVYDRLQEQREAFPLERVYVHTDAEDYLQGDRIWLKAYLMDEVDHTPVDSTLYVYAELFDKNGIMARQVKLLRREGAFYGYLDIPEDLLSGARKLRSSSGSWSGGTRSGNRTRTAPTGVCPSGADGVQPQLRLRHHGQPVGEPRIYEPV